ncbi:MAG: H-NS histone family protein [Burkholderiaceae bacterium]|nr:H-NS histone family protein [Burkholderiaceae bacterium]
MATSVKQLENKINQLKAKKEALQARERKPAIARILAQMREFGINPSEISSAFNGGRQTPKSKTAKANSMKEKPGKGAKTKKPVEAKYRNADTGESWSGRGKPPRWLAAAEASGKSRESLRIESAQGVESDSPQQEPADATQEESA